MANWSSDEVRRASEILSRHTSLGEALPEICFSLQRLVTKSSLEHAFKRKGVSSPGTFLTSGYMPQARPPKASVSAVVEPPTATEDPLERHIKAREERSAKAREQELLELLREARERQSVLDAFDAPIRPMRVDEREKSSTKREGTVVVLASDWHVEEVVDPTKIAGRNMYNLNIAKHRATRFFEGIRWLSDFVRNEYTIRDTILWLGGDLMTGHIHEELVETNDCSPVETILELRDMLVGGIDFLLKDTQLESLKIPCSFGNHGRTTQKRRSKTGAENSFEWLLYNILNRHYENEPRVQFGIDKSSHQYVEAYDFRLHFHHGDTVRYWGGLGGLSIPLNKRVPKWDNVLRSDYHHIGHFHSALDLGRVLVNGSLIGYNEYAQDQGCDFEPPQQIFYVLDSKRGKCLPTPIWVDDEPSSKSEWKTL